MADADAASPPVKSMATRPTQNIRAMRRIDAPFRKPAYPMGLANRDCL